MKKIFGFMVLVSLCLSMVTPIYATMILPTKSKTSEPDPLAINAAKAEFKSISKKERKARIKNVRMEIKQLKLDKEAGNAKKVEQVVLIILAILLPPLAVYLHQGEVNSKFWISLLLWFLFILPGVIYALLVVTDSI